MFIFCVTFKLVLGPTNVLMGTGAHFAIVKTPEVEADRPYGFSADEYGLISSPSIILARRLPTKPT
jgi:hypothetical protein